MFVGQGLHLSMTEDHYNFSVVVVVLVVGIMVAVVVHGVGDEPKCLLHNVNLSLDNKSLCHAFLLVNDESVRGKWRQCPMSRL